MKCEEVGAANGTLHISGSEVFSWGSGLLKQQVAVCAGQQPSELRGCGSGPAGITKRGFKEVSLTPSSKVQSSTKSKGSPELPQEGQATPGLKLTALEWDLGPAQAGVQPGLVSRYLINA